jgi:hypothetical protein
MNYETSLTQMPTIDLLQEYESMMLAFAAGESPGLNCERVRLVRREVGRRLSALIEVKAEAAA